MKTTTTVCAASVDSAIRIEDADFVSVFNGSDWSVNCRWKDGPPPVSDRRCNYKIPQEDLSMFEEEISVWIEEGILVPWNGMVKNVLPLMSVRHEKGSKVKVRPVLDFRYLNKFIQNHPGAATPLCQDRLREWRKLG